MSDYYNPNRGEAWNYGGRQWKLSRSKIDLFLKCPRCFYIDNKLGTKLVPGPSFEINKAVDEQLKREFDVHRAKGSKHPLQEAYGIDAKPAQHNLIDAWRENFKGVQYFHEPTEFLVSGAIDDLWVNDKGEYIVVDYKATAKNEPVTELVKGTYHDSYMRQMDVYQWLLRQNGHKVSNTGYFLYCTGKKDQESFDGVIEFDIRLIPYEGDDAWIDGVLVDIKHCLESKKIPECSETCDHCRYYNARKEHEDSDGS